VERRYYLSSLRVDVKRFARAVRSHWSIENQLHWVIDVNFKEDQSRARNGYVPPKTSPLCGVGPKIFIKADQQKKKRSLKGRMKAAGWDNRYLLHLLGINLNA